MISADFAEFSSARLSRISSRAKSNGRNIDKGVSERVPENKMGDGKEGGGPAIGGVKNDKFNETNFH